MTARRSPVTVAASVVVAVVAVLAVVGPWIGPHDPNGGELRNALQSPSADHWLGTDYLGRDVLSRLIAGSRVAAIAGIEATVVALVLGAGIGMVVGLAGGRVDRLAMRAIDGISAIPAIVLAIAIIAALGTGLTRSMFAVGIAFAMGMARLARGLTLSERERLYVDGARVTGAGRWRLLRHHIAPNIAGPIAVQATLVFAAAVTIEAGLSYLGLGVQPPHASWGTMLAAAQRTIRQSAFQAIPPGLAIVLTVLAINVLGDALVRRRRGESYDHPAGYLEPAPIAPVDRAGAASHPAGEPPVLDVAGLTVRYGDVVAVDGVDLSIAPGEVVALVGESGSGKTSLAMAVAGLLTPPAAISAARLTLATSTDRLELVGASAQGRRRWRTDVGVVFQEPAASLNPLQTVGRQLADVIRAQRRTRPAPAVPSTDIDAGTGASTGASDASDGGGDGIDRGIDREVVALLRDVGLPRPEDVARLRPGQISGGMAQRVMIALALAKQPELLVADEPTTALDVTVQAEIIRLLRRLCTRRRLGVLLVTHDLGVAGELADRCVVLLRGEVVETGPIAAVVSAPEHPYTAALVASVPQNVPGRPILAPLDRDEAAAVAEVVS